MSNLLKPLGQRLLVKPFEVSEKIGSIFIPENAKEKSLEGLVLEVGLGRRDKNGKHQEFDVQVGDKILFNKFGGSEIKIKGIDLKLIDEGDVLAILPE
jgi:chaperonin GroES